MLQPFFITAMRSTGRHIAFRHTVALHVLLLTCLGWVAAKSDTATTLAAVGQMVLILGIVEGATLIGWRLTQLPRSQALEFLLVSPVQPRRLFFAEALVGVMRLALVSLAGLPVLLVMVIGGVILPDDLWTLVLMPFVWGVVTGLGLTVWAYESADVRRVGEIVGLVGVLIYLVVGILAGENLRLWINRMAPAFAGPIVQAVMVFHHGNPFGIVRNWFIPGAGPGAVWPSFVMVNLLGLGLIGLFGLRAAFRLKSHFHERHYTPLRADRVNQSPLIGERPLAWWAVRRVMVYSGRLNLWLAGGFCLLYAAYLVAGDRWPPWLGRVVFQIFEGWGGAPMVATAMCVLAAVPAAFQYGLWDATISERCQRVELLLLTELRSLDYWHASLAAAWRRGRGYLVIALIMWLALALSGRVAWYAVLAAAEGGLVLWAFSFAVGFRAFSTGNQASGVASMLTLGMPFLLVVLLRGGHTTAAAFVPTAVCYLPLAIGITWSWAAGLVLVVALTAWFTYRGLTRCEPELRAWYDRNQGRKTE